jgi:hypothetical protein
MYLIRNEGYSSDTNNNYSSTLDYIAGDSWGYDKDCSAVAISKYIEYRNYYACTGLDLVQPITWDLWSENWELIDTNWNNEII